MMMGPGPAVNHLPTPRATLKVSNIPSFVTSDDFSRLMLQLEGCVDARLLGRRAGGGQGWEGLQEYHGWSALLVITAVHSAVDCSRLLQLSLAGSLAVTRWATVNFLTR